MGAVSAAAAKISAIRCIDGQCANTAKKIKKIKVEPAIIRSSRRYLAETDQSALKQKKYNSNKIAHAISRLTVKTSQRKCLKRDVTDTDL